MADIAKGGLYYRGGGGGAFPFRVNTKYFLCKNRNRHFS
jgi:hypothetical protein